jgi:hypothetical protein
MNEVALTWNADNESFALQDRQCARGDTVRHAVMRADLVHRRDLPGEESLGDLVSQDDG